MKTDLTIGLRNQKHICPICKQSLVNEERDLIILYRDENEHNRKPNNLVVMHKHCYEGGLAITINIENRNNGKSELSRTHNNGLVDGSRVR